MLCFGNYAWHIICTVDSEIYSYTQDWGEKLRLPGSTQKSPTLFRISANTLNAARNCDAISIRHVA